MSCSSSVCHVRRQLKIKADALFLLSFLLSLAASGGVLLAAGWLLLLPPFRRLPPLRSISPAAAVRCLRPGGGPAKPKDCLCFATDNLPHYSSSFCGSCCSCSPHGLT